MCCEVSLDSFNSREACINSIILEGPGYNITFNGLKTIYCNNWKSNNLAEDLL